MPPTLYLPVKGKWSRNTLYFPEEGSYLCWSVPMDQHERTNLDIWLERGYQFYMDATCPMCGLPAWHGRTEDDRVVLETHLVTCYSCAAKETLQKAHKDGLKPGQSITVEATGASFADGTSDPLPPIFELMQKIPH